MSAYVRIPTAMTEREVLVEAIRQCKFTVQAVGDKITVPNIVVYGYMLTFEPSAKGFIAAGMDLRVNQQTQQQLAQINEAYKAIIDERLRVAAEAERQRILEEQRKLVAERTAALLAQAKQRNFRVKDELVNGKKRFTFVKMVIQ
jgi:DNA gyrase/topoisomerase IV subunit A